jgi:hypothetical protein
MQQHKLTWSIPLERPGCLSVFLLPENFWCPGSADFLGHPSLYPSLVLQPALFFLLNLLLLVFDLSPDAGVSTFSAPEVTCSF